MLLAIINPNGGKVDEKNEVGNPVNVVDPGNARGNGKRSTRVNGARSGYGARGNPEPRARCALYGEFSRSGYGEPRTGRNAFLGGNGARSGYVYARRYDSGKPRARSGRTTG